MLQLWGSSDADTHVWITGPNDGSDFLFPSLASFTLYCTLGAWKAGKEYLSTW